MVIILPVNDIKNHDEESTVGLHSQTVEFINGEMLLIHNSFDGREFEEQIKEILDDSTESN